MKIQFGSMGILSIVVLFGTLLIPSNVVCATNQQCPIDVQILYSDASWCSGITLVENSTVLAWDVITITFVTLGVANLDTAKHSLNQIILTIDEVNEGGSLSFLKSEQLTSNVDLPLILYPQRYWLHNFSCSQCQSLTKISLEVDGEWFEFAPPQLLSDAGIYVDDTHWPPHWSKVSYYTESQITPVSVLGIFSSVGLVIIFVFRWRRREI
ncbi:MAG: hypothetical protein ACFFBD_02090 [Candidatus Hodarchaeota archaeon]